MNLILNANMKVTWVLRCCENSRFSYMGSLKEGNGFLIAYTGSFRSE